MCTCRTDVLYKLVFVNRKRAKKNVSQGFFRAQCTCDFKCKLLTQFSFIFSYRKFEKLKMRQKSDQYEEILKHFENFECEDAIIQTMKLRKLCDAFDKKITSDKLMRYTFF